MTHLSDRELDSRVAAVLAELDDWQKMQSRDSGEITEFRRERWLDLAAEIMAIKTEQAELLSGIARVPLDDLYVGHDIFTYLFKYGPIEPVLKMVSRFLVHVGSRDSALRMLRLNLAQKFWLHTNSAKDTYDPGSLR